MKLLKIITVVLVVLAVISYASFDYIIEKKLTEKLEQIINKDSLNYYTYSIENLDLSLASGSLTLTGVKITPTTHAFDSLKNPGNLVRVLVSFQCDELALIELQIKHFFRTNELIIDQLEIIKPTVIYLFNEHKRTNKNTLVMQNIFSPNFKKAKLKKLELTKGEIRVTNIEDSLPLVNIKDYSLRLTNAYIDSNTIKRFSPFNYDNIEFWSESLQLNVSQDFAISTGKMEFDAKHNSTIIQNFKLKPFYKQGAFSAKYNMQKQWVAITLDTFEIVDIQFEDLIQHGDFVLNKVRLVKANVGLYKDKTKPEPPFKKKLLPASAMRKLPVNLTIDTVVIKNSRITINEQGKKDGSVSELRFEQLNAQLYGFTNDSVRLAKNKYMAVQAKSRVMGAVPVTFTARFDMLSPTDEHWVKAQVGSCDPTIFNKVLNPMMLVDIKSGKILGLNYQYQANDTEAIGTLDFEYENIKIEVFNKAQQHKKNGFLSMAANSVIRSSNTKNGGKEFAHGIIKAKRIQNKNIFPYLWHTVQSGIIYTMAPALSEVKKEEKQAGKKSMFKKKK